MATAQPSRFSRLLALVPYFSARQGISVDQAARDLGVTPTQLTRDLEQLFVCGLPGYYPDDLIELEFSEGHVDVGFTAGMDRPLRLTSTESSTLLVALRALLDIPGVIEREATLRAIAKIEEAVGASTAAVASPGADGGEDENPAYAAVRDAVGRKRAMSISYYSATRDSVSDRVVDPISVQVLDNHTYLEAWCRRSDGVRLFRVDRIDTASVRDEPAAPPPGEAATGGARRTSLFADDAQLPSAQIEIDATEAWILDYYATVEPVADVPDAEAGGPIRARIGYGSPEWLVRFLLGFGGRVRVVDQPEIAAAVGAAARDARARYR